MTAVTLMTGVTWIAPVAQLAHAQSTTLIGGGLTALPAVTLGSNKIANSGFESGAAAPWSGGSGWTMDQLTRHSGIFSYRRDAGAPTASTRLELKPGIYTFSAWVKTQDLGAGMRLQFDFRPAINNWFNLEIASGTADWKLYELKDMVVTQTSTVTLGLESANDPSGTAWFDDVKLAEQLPQSVEAFLLYPNFRGMLFDDGPSTMKFDIKVTPPGHDFGRYTVRGQLRDEATGQVVATQSYPASASFVARLEGGGMQMGRAYLATFALIDGAAGTPVYTYPAYRVSRAPASARQSMHVSFDVRNRVLIKGQPRFILGVYDSGMGESAQDAFWENALWSSTGERRMGDMKINMYLNYGYGEAPLEAMNALMTNLQKRGVTYLQAGNCFNTSAAGTNFSINSSEVYVQRLGAHPGSAGYYTIDECVSTLIPGAFEQYSRLRRLDPDSITFSANFGNPDLHLWRDAADIIATDPYPMYGAEPADGYHHRTVADWTAIARNAVKNARPVMTVLQFFRFTPLGRWPTLTEMRNHAYMAIVEGARGLWWWSLGDSGLAAVCPGWCTEKTGYMNNLRSVVNEIAALEPVLLTDDAAGALAGSSNTNIRTKVKLVDGKGYLFAYNAASSGQSATFTWNTAPGAVTVNGEHRTVGASGRSFSDTFGPFAAHLYVIGNGGSDATPAPTSPTISFSAPGAGATVSGTTTVTLAGGSGSGGYTYTLTAGTTAVSGSGPRFSWNTTTAPNGAVTLRATVRDSAGRTASATRTVMVSNTTAPRPSTGTMKPAVTPPEPSTMASGATRNGLTGPARPAPGSVPDGSHPPGLPVTDSSPGRATAPRTNASASPSTGTLRVAITQPKPSTTVRGTAWAVLWVDGQSGTSNTFELFANDRLVASQVTASRGPVSLPWITSSTPNGAARLRATVKDATGKTGATAIGVTVAN